MVPTALELTFQEDAEIYTCVHVLYITACKIFGLQLKSGHNVHTTGTNPK